MGWFNHLYLVSISKKFSQQSVAITPWDLPGESNPSVQVKSFDENQMVFTRACNAGKGDAWVPWIPEGGWLLLLQSGGTPAFPLVSCWGTLGW